MSCCVSLDIRPEPGGWHPAGRSRRCPTAINGVRLSDSSSTATLAGAGEASRTGARSGLRDPGPPGRGRTGAAALGGAPIPDRDIGLAAGYPLSVRPSRIALVIGASWSVAAGLTAVFSGSTKAQASAHPVTTISIKQAHAYTPKAPPGATDDYHCTVMNPHIQRNSYIISSQFFPGSVEDHHAILFLVPPDLAAKAEADNVNGQGWSCFGETPIPNTGLNQISNTPWLSAWAPGHGLDNLPKGTGVYLPAGSLVVMQVHYNLLVGDKPVKNSLVLNTVPASTPLLP